MIFTDPLGQATRTPLFSHGWGGYDKSPKILCMYLLRASDVLVFYLSIPVNSWLLKQYKICLYASLLPNMSTLHTRAPFLNYMFTYCDTIVRQWYFRKLAWWRKIWVATVRGPPLEEKHHLVALCDLKATGAPHAWGFALRPLPASISCNPLIL